MESFDVLVLTSSTLSKLYIDWKKLKRGLFLSNSGGYRTALAVDRVHRIVALSNGEGTTSANHAPKSKVAKGYLAFIQDHC
jgi:hypothetical protein